MQNLTLSLFELQIGADLLLGLLFLASISAYLRVARARIAHFAASSGK
jgi:hypothetical protein